MAVNIVTGRREAGCRITTICKCKGYSTDVKTTMRMLTILREAEEWTRVHLREACLSAVRECNNEKLALSTSKRQSACTSNNFTFARPLMGTIYF